MQKGRFEFKGVISFKKILIQNIIAFILSTTFFLFTFHDIVLTIISSVLFDIILLISLWHKIKKSQIILTETECKISECKLFGLIKIEKRFDIILSEQDTLINYFIFLGENEQNIPTFSIKSINELLKYNVIFKNNNLII